MFKAVQLSVRKTAVETAAHDADCTCGAYLPYLGIPELAWAVNS